MRKKSFAAILQIQKPYASERKPSRNCRTPSNPTQIAIMQITLEEVMRQRVEVMRQQKMVSISLFQRQLGLGCPRVARTLDILEAPGHVGPSDRTQPRKILKL